VDDIGPLFALAIVVFCVVLAIAWIILPFALIGTKPLLRELIDETRRTNALLELRKT
jgi:hypothetical protein